MKTSTKYSVSNAAALYKKSRATLYKDIKNGVLSRDSDGFIDFSELLRVYGEPFSGHQRQSADTFSIQNINTHEYTDQTVIELKNQIDFLKKQLEKSEDREAKANSRIDTLLTLIEMKPSKPNITPSAEQKSESDISGDPQLALESKHDELTTPEQTENKRISVPKHFETEPKKRGFLSRFFLPNG